MASVNKVILVGNLGRDPELKYTQSGTPICTFSMATTEKWKDGEHTEWHRIVAWGKLAEICGEYLAKGKQVYVEGSIRSRSYEADGQKKTMYEIKADEVKFLGARGEGGGSARREAPAAAERSGPGPEPGVADEDIPF